MLKKILVAVDGSDASIEAFEYALSLAEKLKAELEVLVVVDQRKTQVPLMYAGGSYDLSYERVYIPPDQELQAFYERLRGDLYSFAEKCLDRCESKCTQRGIAFSRRVVEGYPAEEIEKEALSADIVVVGQYGENAGIKKETVGSTTEELARKSPRPLLVCPGKREKLEKILIPYDGSRTAERALQFYTAHFGGVAPELALLCAECGQSDKDVFRKELEYLDHHQIKTGLIKDERAPIHAISRYFEQNGADMIIIGSHGRNKLVDYLLGSTTIHLIRKTTIPVLVVY